MEIEAGVFFFVSFLSEEARSDLQNVMSFKNYLTWKKIQNFILNFI